MEVIDTVVRSSKSETTGKFACFSDKIAVIRRKTPKIESFGIAIKCSQALKRGKINRVMWEFNDIISARRVAAVTTRAKNTPGTHFAAVRKRTADFQELLNALLS